MRGAPAAMTALEALGERLLPRPEGKCLLGLSGGADSVGLLHLLLPLREEGSISLEAIHVNHGLRGAESDSDEQFCRDLCERTGVPLTVCRAELHGRTRRHRLASGKQPARIREHQACRFLV